MKILSLPHLLTNMDICEDFSLKDIACIMKMSFEKVMSWGHSSHGRRDVVVSERTLSLSLKREKSTHTNKTIYTIHTHTHTNTCRHT
jgi:hypothetical protein